MLERFWSPQIAGKPELQGGSDNLIVFKW